MIISLAVILVPAVLIYWWFSRVPDEPQVPAADWKPVVTAAKGDAAYPLLSPQGLPDTWKPIRAIWKDQQLQLGFLSPDTVYYDFKQAPGTSNPGLVNDMSREGKPDGTSTVGALVWERVASTDGRTKCLVNKLDGAKPATRVVCADAPYEAVETFVGILK